MLCNLITRRLSNGWYHIHCRTCGTVLAVVDRDSFVCPCPNNKMATPSLQKPKVSADVEVVEQKAEVPKEDEPAKESVKPTRRRRKPRAKKTKETAKPAE